MKLLKKAFLIWSLLILLLSSFAGEHTDVGNIASAQSGGSWTPPVNLSNSGSSTSPSMVVDSNGVINVIWYDAFVGYKYVESSDGMAWAQPVLVNFPFQDYQPLLISDGNSLIYAFWRDAEGALYFSRVFNGEFGNGASWESSQLLAQNALAYDIALDDNGTIHLAYIRPLETFDAPAGVYYRNILSGGGGWSTSQSIQTSLYFRGLTVADAHISIASGVVNDLDAVYITWDERPLRRVYLLRSLDGGNSWGDPSIVDQPTVETGFATPFDPDVDVWNGSLLLLWKIGDPLGSCTHQYQVSSDAGDSWTSRGDVLAGAIGCSVQKNVLSRRADMLLWQANINGQINFLAWNGNQWSSSQIQSDLASIENPLTYEYFGLGCLQFVDQPNSGQILAAGCEQGQSGDIWFTSRSLGEFTDWFPSPSAWGKPEELFNASAEMDSLELIADHNGNFHAFWTQPVEEDPSVTGSSIYYSQWDGVNWSSPIAMLVSPNGEVSNPSIALSQDGRLYVAWSSGQIGELYFSWAQAERAFNPTEWFEPISLPAPSFAASSVDLSVAPSGEILVAYAIPLNEGRGIYFVMSSDEGVTWSGPFKVFDAVLADWDMVQSPHLIVAPSGKLHLLWQRLPLPGVADPQILYYSRYMGDAADVEFTGLAQGWSFPQLVDEDIILWSRILNTGDNSLIRLWQGGGIDDNVIRFQVSQDDGINWSQPEVISNLGEILGPADLIRDHAGQLHIFQINQQSQNNPLLGYWHWDGEDLQRKDDLEIGQRISGNIESVAAAISQDGQIGVMYTGKVAGEISDLLTNALFFVGRTVDLPDPLPTTTAQIIMPIVMPSPTSIPNPTTETPLSTLPAENVQSGGLETGSANNQWFGVIVAIGIVLIITVLAFGARIVFLKAGK